MNKIREILNEIKWRKPCELSQTEIVYIHRGSQGNVKSITGEDIVSIDKTFIVIKDAMIPHHRIIKIYYKGKIIFDREKDT